MARKGGGMGTGEDDHSTHNEVSASHTGPLVQARDIHGGVHVLHGQVARSAYLEQVRRIAPETLFDRDAELTELAAWCTGEHDATYTWWRAPAWSGKSALLSWFVLHPPPGVRVVSFFVTARLSGQNDKTAFAEVVLEQLAELLGRPLPELLTDATRDAHLLRLLADAAATCAGRDERLVLVVDGLDEDRGVTVGPDGHSIAALLPADPPDGCRIVVAGRPDPPVPADVPDRHPLRREEIVRPLDRSRHADVVRVDAQRELGHLLRGTPTERDLLGLVVAAGGGLTGDDLAELTGLSAWDVEEHLRGVSGRTFSRRDTAYLLAHEQLQQQATRMLGDTTVGTYRRRLHDWADRYREQGWPAATPEYLLRGYVPLLRETRDATRLAAVALDRARHTRLLDLVGSDSAAITEATAALDVLAALDEPNLHTVTRLAGYRDELAERNFLIPTGLPEAWSRLGQHARAEALARTLPDPGQQARALVAVARAMEAAGDREGAEAIMRTVPNTQWFVSKESIRRPASRSRRRFDIRAAIAKGDLRQAERMTRRERRGPEQSRTLAQIVTALAAAGDLAHAETVARDISNLTIRRNALTGLVVPLAEAGEPVRAKELATEIERMSRSTRADRRPDDIVAVLSAVALAGDVETAVALASTLTEPRRQTAALTELAVAMAADVDRAQTIANAVPEPRGRILALVELGRALAGTNPAGARQVAAAARTAAVRDETAVQSVHEFAEVSAHLATAVALSGQLDEAESFARNIGRQPWREAALTDLVATAAVLGQPARAEAIARDLADPSRALVAIIGAAPARADALLDAITEPRWRARALTSLVASGQPTRIDAAMTAVDSITYTAQRSQALAELAAAVATSGDLDRAEALARTIPVSEWRTRSLGALARTAADTGDPQRARAVADTIDDPNQRARTLAHIATCLDGREARRLVTHVLHTYRWTAALTALATLAPEVVLAIGRDVLSEQD